MQYTSLVRNNDFVRAYKRGKSWVHPQVVLYVNKNRAGGTRVGITASKKIGNAVQRNRARRVIRNALYKVLPQNAGPVDLVFVARGQTLRVKSTQLEPVLRKLLKQANIPVIEDIENPTP
ncbi:ribonuclease P protein component [Ruminococcaceae bacterium OttesenSCG-928-A16]|nr:ribonuclease P protein component [Ruminococcaceae bacterium OttesenSCG-928-A16]